jgi:arylsulfatase A-like enzyme
MDHQEFFFFFFEKKAKSKTNKKYTHIGGSTWFGGLNYPLRSGKLTVFEGGCRVPAFAVDFSADKRFLGKTGVR